MKRITFKQELYIYQHAADNPVDIAEMFQLPKSTVYAYMKKARCYAAYRGKDKQTKRNIIRELYPNFSATEISLILGISNATVNVMARRLCVRHTDETNRRINKHCLEVLRNPESVRKSTLWKKKAFAIERFRIMSGLPQKTKLRVGHKVEEKQINARCYLCRKYNYFYDKEYGDMLTIHYDKDTKRISAEKELKYTMKYGIKFSPAEE